VPKAPYETAGTFGVSMMVDTSTVAMLRPVIVPPHF